ncbi:MAG: ATP-binding protein [Planctomycetota bacterium]
MARSAHHRWIADAIVPLVGAVTTFAAPARAQLPPLSVSVRTWTAEHGLPQDYVSSLALGPDGYVWVGTWGGLARFDGVHFTSFQLEDHAQAPGNRVGALCADHQRRVWVGTGHNGIAVWNGTHFRQYPETVGRASIRDIVEDGNGTIWALGGTVLRLRDDVFVEAGPAALPIHDLAIDETGRVVACTTTALLVETEGEFTPLPHQDDLGTLQRLMRDPTGRLWVFGTGGVGHLEGHRLVIDARAELGWIHSAWCREEGTLLTVATGDGAHSYRVEAGRGGVRLRATAAELPLSLRSDPQLAAALIDPAGSLWLGSYGAGLHRVRTEPFTTLPATKPIPHPPPLTFAAGAMWSSRQHAVFRWDNFAPRRIHVPAPPNGPGAPIEPRAAAADGTLWLLSLEGKAVGRWHDNRTQWFPLQDWPRGLAVTPSGVAWVGLDRVGVLRLEDGDATTFAVPAALRSPTIHCWAEATGAWFSADGHIGRVRPDGAVECLALPEVATRAQIRAMQPGPDGELWIATYGAGLLRWHNGALRRIGSAEGLADSSLGGLLVHRDRLWVNSNKGVQILRLAELNAVADGTLPRVVPRLLATGETDGAYAAVDDQGRLWFSTVDGVSIVLPSLCEQRTTPTVARVEDVAGDHAPPEAWQTTANGQRRAHFPCGTQNLEISYAGLSFDAPEDVSFRYRLLGYDDEWVHVGTRRTAYFTRVPPGDYEFEVAATDATGDWSPSTAHLALRIAPHFYQTLWFKVGLVLLGVGALAWQLHSRARIRAERHAQLLRELRERDRAERAERDRNRLAENLRETRRLELVGRLTSGIAHDFNNVLTVILGSAENLLRRFRGSPDLPSMQDARNIEDCAVRAASLTRQLLAFGRRQMLHPRVVDLNAVIDGILPMLRQLLPAHIELQVQDTAAGPLVYVDTSQLEQVIMNLVLNARDAMADGGRITIGTTIRLRADPQEDSAALQERNHAVLTIEDAGCGITPEVLPHVFEPFYTTKAGTLGTGLGLASVHGIVAQSGGHVAVTSDVGRGSTFEVWLPIAEGKPEPLASRATATPETVLPSPVLVCEDYAPIRTTLTTTLRSRGAEVHDAPRATEALETAARLDDVALLITDLGLPDRSGADLAARVRHLHPRACVLFISGRLESDGGAAKLDATAYLEKPFTPSQLLQKVQELVQARPGQRPDAVADDCA